MQAVRQGVHSGEGQQFRFWFNCDKILFPVKGDIRVRLIDPLGDEVRGSSLLTATVAKVYDAGYLVAKNSMGAELSYRLTCVANWDGGITYHYRTGK